MNPVSYTHLDVYKRQIYQHVINQITKQHIHEIEQQGMVCMRQNIDEAESPQILANYLGKVIRQKLEEIENQEDRVNLINNILKEAGIIDEIQIAEPSKLLTEVMSRQQALLQAESRIQTIRDVYKRQGVGIWRLVDIGR